MPLTKWINKIEKVIAISERSLEEAVEESENTLVEMQKERMEMGLDANGKPIEYNKPRKSPLNETGAYTRKYSKKKEKFGQTKVVDLEGKTGAYKRGLKAKTTRGNNEVDIDFESDVKYALAIEKNYDDIYGLDKTQQDKIENEISRKIEDTITKHLES